MASDQSRTYLWCASCRRSFNHLDVLGGACPICGTPVQPVGKWSAIMRGLMSQELAAPELQTKHRQLVRMIWTRNGMGEQYYRVLEPGIPYSRFEAQVTDLLCRGAVEGWARFIMPPAPTQDESAYRLELVDEDRFIIELEALFKPEGGRLLG